MPEHRLAAWQSNKGSQLPPYWLCSVLGAKTEDPPWNETTNTSISFEGPLKISQLSGGSINTRYRFFNKLYSHSLRFSSFLIARQATSEFLTTYQRHFAPGKYSSSIMRTSSILLALGAAKSVFSSLIVGRNACNEDNCLRGVDGTDANIRPVLTSRLSDCSSYMTITVTPAPVLVPAFFSCELFTSRY
jgi:hypothetical protein